jgi:hypothetical protein
LSGAIDLMGLIPIDSNGDRQFEIFTYGTSYSQLVMFPMRYPNGLQYHHRVQPDDRPPSLEYLAYDRLN